MPALTAFHVVWLLSPGIATGVRRAFDGAGGTGHGQGGHPALCDARIVDETCRLLNRPEGDQFFGDGADSDLGVVHAAELSEQLAASRRSVIGFLTEVGAPKVAGAASVAGFGAFAVSCAELCSRTVASLPGSHRPPTSDVGCYLGGGARPVCDVDVSDEAFSGLRFDSLHSPHAHEAAKRSPPDTGAKLQAIADKAFADKDFQAMQVAVSNLFRIYPLTRTLTTASGDVDEMHSSLAEVAAAQAAGHSLNASARAAAETGGAATNGMLPTGTFVTWTREDQDVPAGSVGVVTAVKRDGDVHGLAVSFSGGSWNFPFYEVAKYHIQRGDWVRWSFRLGELAPYGGLGMVLGWVKGRIDVKYAGGHWAFLPEELVKMEVQKGSLVNCISSPDAGTLPEGSIGKAVSLTIQERSCVRVEFSTTTWCLQEQQLAGFWMQLGTLVRESPFGGADIGIVKQVKGDGHVVVQFPRGRKELHATKLHLVSGQDPWTDTVQRRNAQAQAYVAKTLRRMSAREIPKKVQKWFGSNSKSARETVRRVLNGISDVLSNVEYVYDQHCEKGTFAYMYTAGLKTRNWKRQYLFFLCDTHMTSSPSVQIEVLTHEASHHKPGRTDDVCADGGDEDDDCSRAYGRGTCEELARSYPDKALNNADNYCFFVNDANDVKDRGGLFRRIGKFVWG